MDEITTQHLNSLRRMPETIWQIARTTTSEARPRLDNLDRRATESEQAVRQAIAKHLEQKPSPDPTKALLNEIREIRSWQRSLRLLESGADVADVVMAVTADRDGIRALRAELPTYLRSQHREGELKAAINRLDSIEDPLLTPTQQEARKIRTELDFGCPRIREAIQAARQRLAGDTTITAIPLWGDDELPIE